MKPLLLGTTSKYKRVLFQRLGLEFEQAAPPFEEYVSEDLAPQDLASNLAIGKAKSLSESYPNHLIIGADQVLALGKKIYTKPETNEKAVDQLLSLAGKTHALHTAFALWVPSENRLISRVVSAYMTFHDNLCADFLRQMVESDATQDCVGGYKYESQGIFLFEKVETSDVNTIIGLPLSAMIEELSALGYFPDRFDGNPK